MKRLIKATAATMLLCAGLAHSSAAAHHHRPARFHTNWVTFSDCVLRAHLVVGHQPNGIGQGALYCSSVHKTLQLYIATDVEGSGGTWYRKDYTAVTYHCGNTKACNLGNFLPDTNMTDSVNGHVYRTEVSGIADNAVKAYVSGGCTLGAGCEG